MTPLVGWLLLSGCFRIDYTTGAPQASVMPNATEMYNVGIFGLVEFSNPVPLNVLCPQGYSRVHNEVSVRDAAIVCALGLANLSWIYQPSTVTVWCRSGRTWRAELDDDGLVVRAEPVEESSW